MTMEEVFGVVEQDLTDFWGGVFEEQGQSYPKPDLVLWDGFYIDTGCGTIPAEAGPLYCTIDYTIYFPVGFSEWLYSLGDFAVAAAIAHEWGHSVQDLLGIFGELAPIDTELQADCFAGAYAEYIANRSQLLLLEEGDIQEGADTFFTLGDPEGTDWFDPRAHGSGYEREQAFDAGVEGGYNACLV
jgi:predicted metalloprotease